MQGEGPLGVVSQDLHILNVDPDSAIQPTVDIRPVLVTLNLKKVYYNYYYIYNYTNPPPAIRDIYYVLLMYMLLNTELEFILFIRT